MTPAVLVLTTGGTIGHSSRRGGAAALDFDPAELAMQLGISGVDITFEKVFQKGSMDIGPDEWLITVQVPELAVLEDGTPAPEGTPEDEAFYPGCFRDSSEIRPAPEPEPEAQ